MIPVILAVIIIVFLLNELMPGDPVHNRLGETYTQEEYDAMEREMGLDRPIVVRMADYVWGVITRLDLGTSYDSNQPVINQIRSRIWTSVEIGLLSVCVVILIGIPIGVASAVKQNSALDYSVTTVSIFLASVPSFWLALMCMILFSLKMKILPATGLSSWKHYILPVACNSLMTIASTTRMTRSSMLEVIRQDYIRTARAKGLKEIVILRKHALKNALIPVVTTIGVQFGMLVGGSIIIETIFSIPGMGMLMITSINNRDYPMIMGITLIISVFVSVVNLLVDLVYSFIDPRIKAQFAGQAAQKRNLKKASARGETA